MKIFSVLFCGTLFTNFCIAATASINETCSSSAQGCNIPVATLSNGVKMPMLALGTAPLSFGNGETFPPNPSYAGFLPENVYRSVQLALESGMRHFDTAYIYRSHEAIRHVIATWFTSGLLKREDLFLTSKVFHGPSHLASLGRFLDMDEMTVEQVTETVTCHVESSLQELGVGYVDLMLLHWPSSFDQKDNATMARAKRSAAWKVLETYHARGWARAIGVSNFSPEHFEQLKQDGATIQPMVNQIETSVYIQHDSIIKYCQEHGIVVQAYSPFGRGIMNIFKDETVSRIATKHNKTPGQVALKFLMQLGSAATFYSSSGDRIKSNVDIFSFDLDDEDMKQLRALKRKDGSWGLQSPLELK